MSSSYFKIVEHTVPCQHIREYPNALKHRQEDVSSLAIKQYIPLDNLEPEAGAVTIIAGHANGFPKEIYEPLWDDLLGLSKTHGFSIKGIWAADMSHQGASGILNEHLQGDDPSWFDHSRDLLSMINHFRDQMPRPLVGIGHSMGAAELVHLSIIHPRLLSTLILMEPVIQKTPAAGPNAAFLATYRPDLWPSRAVAEAAFRKNKFFQSWDPRVLTKYLKYALREVPTALYPTPEAGGLLVPVGAVTLATTKHQEAWSYVRPNFEPQAETGHPTSTDRLLSPDLDPKAEGRYLFHRAESVITLANLPFLRPSVLYIFGNQSPMSTMALQAEKMELTGAGLGGSGGARVGKVKKAVFTDHGHLVPCEQVTKCAELAAEWLGGQLKQIEADDDFYKRYQSRKSERDMMVVSKEWKKLVREPATATRPIKERL